VIVAGDRRPYLTALITLDPDTLHRFAKEQSILYSSFESLTQHPNVLSQIRQTVTQVNEKLPSFEKIKKFLVLDHPFSAETGQLTPSLKAKRKLILNKYQQKLSSLYEELDSLIG
jgi:long-chain acyl-CoA synthetase